jgi:hypothetical protein
MEATEKLSGQHSSPLPKWLGPSRAIAPLERLPNVEPVRGDIRLSESEQELNGFWAGGHVPFDLPVHGCIEEVDGTRKCPQQSPQQSDGQAEL